MKLLAEKFWQEGGTDLSLRPMGRERRWHPDQGCKDARAHGGRYDSEANLKTYMEIWNYVLGSCPVGEVDVSPILTEMNWGDETGNVRNR